MSKLVIALFLPRVRLCHGDDDHKITVGTTMMIGQRFRVVLRSLERAFDPDFTPSWIWEEKWKKMMQADASTVLWLSSLNEYENQSVHCQLNRCVCLAMGIMPPKVPKPKKPDLISLSLRAGLPIALWVRSEDAGTDLRKKIENELVANLATLPDLILEKRSLAQAGAASPWPQIALLWDDPGRVPPSSVLLTPREAS